MSVSRQPERDRESNTDGRGSHAGTLRNGLVGGVAAVLLSVLPLSEVLGGTVAGYLDRGSGRSGAAAGAVAGVVAALPYLLAGLYLATATGVALPGPDLALGRELVVAGAASVGVVYVVGLGVLGGLFGGCVRDER